MSNDAKSDSSLRWVKIGVIIAAIAALITAFPIYQWYSQKEEKLLATGTFSKFVLPEQVRNDVFKYKSFSYEEIDSILKTIPTKEGYNPLSEPRNKILEYIQKVEESSEKSLKTIQPLSGFAEIEVVNDGLRQAENVTLEFNKEGYYQINASDKLNHINQDSDLPALQKFTNSIALGNIRPKTSVKLYIWSNLEFNAFEKALVTYTNGAEPIIFNSTKENKFGFWSFLFIIAVVLLVLGNTFQFGFKVGKNSVLSTAKTGKILDVPAPEEENESIDSKA